MWMPDHYGSSLSDVAVIGRLRPTQRAVSLAFIGSSQHSVHPTGGSLRVFRHFAWLGVGSGKVTFSRPAHQRVTQAVGRGLSRGCGYSVMIPSL